jgi:DNA replicative helicase MCM subunit Mcm2 (Cdc46/Mcm family)
MRLTESNLEKRNVRFENGFFTCLICGCTWSVNQKREQIRQPKNCWKCPNDPSHSGKEYEAQYKDTQK